ncbi:flavohemoglobin expression-modulating QEGLA motif protein [Vibrio sp. SCSIO 43137]|uniref:flavohemoglobin expression-modulating QEGLA motif protein n=1 Tax=Vibrio sp. SCSIO 43137 TaxID=3021011 RepID=UPI002307DD6C|nr:flavohemoglobin expression-modulating QEGLA motif protein [Vibrio sp. SCSIO 43137]WCE32201.1 flavohemoglobin expression-modulating QEGLA motif protein [Vibrio sp. SCSIO 43137]
MLTLNLDASFTLDEMIRMIDREQPFQGLLAGSGCFIKIDEDLPVVCTAIHAGSQMRPELIKQCELSTEERYFEEDPYTDQMIMSQPITLIGLDSRFEYDLNRPKALSTYHKSAWNKQVWKKALSENQRKISHSKHELFYLLYEALITKLESMFRHVIVFDMHSYNHQRIEKASPVFNIGSTQIDMERWGPIVERFTSELKKIPLPNISTTAEVDAVFEGRGYLIAHTNAHFDRTLVLPTEVKKVFMDEQSGALFPLVLESVQIGLKQAFSATSAYFQRKVSAKSRVRRADMLSSQIDTSVLSVDKSLFRLAKKIETLKYVNPTNLVRERARFFAAPRRYKPNYRYRQLPVNANEFKHQLYKLPIDRIADPDLKGLYSDMIDKLSEKVDLLTSVGQDSFLYSSLKYHGRPDTAALKNARFLLYAQELDDDAQPEKEASYAKTLLSEAASRWGMKCKITETASLAAKAMVSSNPPTLFFNSGATYGEKEIARLIQHELGVHMATTLNARMQPISIFRLGLPGSTFTQEGLAILAEFKAGFMSLDRLKILAARVLAVDSMLKEQDFFQTYSYLTEELEIESQLAFNITTRVYRGGGFTKDHLYLAGFVELLHLSESRTLDNLLIGKCSVKYHDLIDELVHRQWLKPPFHGFDTTEEENPPILDYLIRTLRNR